MKLYVIGNGFDLHHGLATSYASFGLYLKQSYIEIYDILRENYGLCDLDPSNWRTMEDSLWSDFETSLSLLDTALVLEANSDSLPNLGADDFRDRDRYTFQIEMEMMLKSLSETLFQAFNEFILSAQLSCLGQSKLINIDKDAKFLSFNYTGTLSKFYMIPEKQVLHIHGEADHYGGGFVLGHGIDPKNFEEEPEQPPEGLSDEDLDRWREYMSDNYDHSFELGKEVIMQYFAKTFKNTESIIKDHNEFFSTLQSTDEVIIVGHSLGDVDIPYFEVLARSVHPTARWTATYYAEEDKKHHLTKLRSLGVKDPSIIKMTEI